MAGTNLLQLQNLVKRDKDSYYEEFQLQHRHFLSELEIFKHNPAADSKRFYELVGFLSHVAPCYPKDLSAFPQQLTEVLEQHAGALDPDMRTGLVKALIMLRNRDLLAPAILLPLFFKLFRVHDKQLRKLLASHIVQDIKKTNQKRKNNKLNTMLQNFLRDMLKDPSEIAAKHSLDVMIELYRRNVWNDARTVNVIGTACLSKSTKILVPALQFFLSSKAVREDEDEDEDDDDSYQQKTDTLQKLMRSRTKKTRKRKKQLERAKTALAKTKKRDDYLHPNFPAIQLLNDPQTFAEQLFGSLKRSNERFEVRLMIMNLISRLIISHRLQLDNFYPWIQRYLQPHQQHVTHVLAILSQSCHELVDPDVIQPVVKVLANNFVSDRNQDEAIVVGLNAIREICMRCPLAIEEDLLNDLIQYKSYRNKGVTMAARSLIATFRELNPNMLVRKERGKNAASVVSLKYGETRVADDVDGAQLLEGMEEASGEDEEMESGDEGEQGADVSAQPKAKVSTSRILTDDDFAAIDQLRVEREMDRLAGKKRTEPEPAAAAVQLDFHEEVDSSDLMAHVKRKKLTYEERMEVVKAGRDPDRHFGSKKGQRAPGRTNAEKSKNQPFMLMKHSRAVWNKQARSAKEKTLVRKRHAKQNKMK
mmetsp:Transcript_15846/g.61916  ORF Transcript_15846/g.61916 Transcript_15846/m.61916 type:complete len:647 (-) Transcript_15846:62-2002(-)